jgi:peptidase E
MTTRQIVASSGGFVKGPTWGTIRIGRIVQEMLTRSGKTRPRVCLVFTASGDDAMYYAMCYESLNAAGCDVTELKLFTQPSADPMERLCTSDVVWVGGGSVANLLNLWKLHGVDDAMTAAWEKGVILGGVSAGSVCWHTGGTTDSFGFDLRPVTNGMGLLPYANGVHFNSEEQRRPLLTSLMIDRTLDPVAYSTDDTVAIVYEGTDAVAVITDADVDPVAGPAAYHHELRDGEVIETRLAPGPIH